MKVPNQTTATNFSQFTGNAHLISITEVLSCSSFGSNCTGIPTAERGLMTATNVPGAGGVLFFNNDSGGIKESV